jgi:hypothetical protein
MITPTTPRLSGIRNAVMTLDLIESGIKLVRRLDIAGKYIPHAISNRQNPSMAVYRLLVCEETAIAIDESRNTIKRIVALCTDARLSIEKSDEPIVMHTINTEKTVPKGMSDFVCFSSVGHHSKTNAYMTVSNAVCMAHRLSIL